MRVTDLEGISFPIKLCYKQPALKFCFQQCSVDSQTSPALPASSPLPVFWLEEAEDKTLKAAAELRMCQERWGSLGADGNGVRSAAGRSWGGCVQESGHNLCLCLIFVASLYLFVLEMFLPWSSVVLCARFWGTKKLWGVSAALAMDAAGGHISTKYYPHKSFRHFSSMKNDLSLSAPKKAQIERTISFKCCSALSDG